MTHVFIISKLYNINIIVDRSRCIKFATDDSNRSSSTSAAKRPVSVDI